MEYLIPMLIMVFLFVAISRWIFRINDIVKRLDTIIERLGKVAILFCLFALLACGGGSSSSTGGAPAQPQARFDITSTEAAMTSYSKPSIKITVKNAGAAMGYNVSCHAYAHDAAGVIIDTGNAFPANLGNIGVGVSAMDEAVFFKLNSHGDYKSLTYDCTWLTRN